VQKHATTFQLETEQLLATTVKDSSMKSFTTTKTVQ